MLQFLCSTLANFTDITQRAFERVAIQMPCVLGEGSAPAASAVLMITLLNKCHGDVSPCKCCAYSNHFS